MSMKWSFYSMSLSDASSFTMEQLVFFHDFTLFFGVAITSVVGYVIWSAISSGMVNLWILEYELLEVLWTFLPGGVITLIALPSLSILYVSEELSSPLLTVKVMGHQWYWSYEYSDFNSIEFDSSLSSSGQGLFRLLDVDNRMIIPRGVIVRIITSSSDVIHSWTIPSLGVKVDANPGRLNQVSLQSDRVGLFYGECSEICGSLHSFMPICLEVVPLESFSKWLLSFV
nr:cytochrome c oxidase subunit 2 [Austromenopon atrofulvum]WJJ69849.1 cytochrome c oxidase subunit 2 [Austromenopon atrofulvum]